MRARSRHPSADIATAVAVAAPTLRCACPLTLAAAQGVWAAESPTLTTDIPAQPLRARTRGIRRADGPSSGLCVSASCATRNLECRAGAGLRAQEALTRLLQGTGLRFERSRSAPCASSNCPCRARFARAEANRCPK